MLAHSLRSSATTAIRASAARVPAVRSMATLVDEKRLPSKFGGKYTVTLVPGDGIGREVADSVKEIFEAIKAPVQWEQYDVSGETTGGEALFQEAMDSLKRNKVGLKGILYTPIDQTGHNSWNVAMRQQLDIYASVVVCKSLPGFPTRHADVDLALIRENTEGEYSGLEHQSFPGVVESLKVSTRAKAERIARFAFDFAIKNNRKKVTCVHKANIMKLGDGLFLNTCKRIAEQEYGHTGIKFESMIVDNTAMQLVSRPQQFDVMVMVSLSKLYGAICSNIASALVGGPGITPGCNFGREYALFEPGCRHVGKDIMGANKANPVALILSATMMLRHLGLETQANLIAGATYDLVREGKVRTADLGGNASTTDVTKDIINRIL
ncbi:isocitrate dehydrogenase, NAD-dependent [Cryptococcus wingfieldii CBS 7118]|uniref:Isocitrate dehydrogenase [NAD] subunit 1, mitochondrial n=1 Tax=Cryptococcus wingfieldii CBS 7118 TaxID=1295528 RepID=A0A1E3K8N3_9TREE|nr:isocitrate dehydrogenase, NAD-dependent [Cryptococcus wingfieldii CBS 7118]ODO08592.1 isocitrate dehydrogenase, NAD-dependent [Cryptococcus wingfieldii CBS 7118]